MWRVFRDDSGVKPVLSVLANYNFSKKDEVCLPKQDRRTQTERERDRQTLHRLDTRLLGDGGEEEEGEEETGARDADAREEMLRWLSVCLSVCLQHTHTHTRTLTRAQIT